MEIAKEMAAGRLTLKHLGDTAAAAEADIERQMERNEYDEDEEEEVPAPQRPRVWVLMGGEGDERQESLRTGVNVWAKLQRFPDLLVSDDGVLHCCFLCTRAHGVITRCTSAEHT